MNLSKSKEYCLSSIQRVFAVATLSEFEGNHFSDWLKARNILETLADYDLGDDTWADYFNLVELAFEKGMEFGVKGPGGWDHATKKFKQWSKGKAYSDTLNRRAKKQIKFSFFDKQWFFAE